MNDAYIFYFLWFLVGNLSDTVISSEEEYHIEYASEEARIEVENERRRKQKAKKKLSGVKVKSVEILADFEKNFNDNFTVPKNKDKEPKEVI